MILDVDIGNSRIKWRLSGRAARSIGATRRDIRNLVAECPPLTRIRVSSVGALDLRDQVVTWLAEAFDVTPEVCCVRTRVGSFTTRYEHPSKLGVDRWLAALAAYSARRTPCLVVDAGTALTVDLVTAEGEHLGGYIGPGLSMMVQALASGTGAVKVPLAAVVDSLAPGANTDDAVNHGVVHMAVGLIERAREQLQSRVPLAAPKVVLTGGDAPLLEPFLADVDLEPDLVLDGLALACP